LEEREQIGRDIVWRFPLGMMADVGADHASRARDAGGEVLLLDTRKDAIPGIDASRSSPVICLVTRSDVTASLSRDRFWPASSGGEPPNTAAVGGTAVHRDG